MPTDIANRRQSSQRLGIWNALAFGLVVLASCAGATTSRLPPIEHPAKQPASRPTGSVEQYLIQTAVFHHRRGQQLRARGTTHFLALAWPEYARAAAAYRRYLALYPNGVHFHYILHSLGGCLYYSMHYREAAQIYARVRDSRNDTRFREEAAFMATKSHEEFINTLVADGKLVRPALPKLSDRLSIPIRARPMPDAYRSWQLSLDAYVATAPSDRKAPSLAYQSGQIALMYLDFNDARRRFARIFDRYCSSNLTWYAAAAIAFTYGLEGNVVKMNEWMTRLRTERCFGLPIQSPDPDPLLQPQPTPGPTPDLPALTPPVG